MNPPQVYTCVPHPEPSSLPIPSLWVVPVHQPLASSIVHRTCLPSFFPQVSLQRNLRLGGNRKKLVGGWREEG